MPLSDFIQVGETTLHYLDWGGDGPPLVLGHATGFLARTWEPVATSLVSRYRVVALDFRGQGDSDVPLTGYDWRGLADDLKGFLDALGLVQPLLIGHSLGGCLAAYLEASSPGTFSRLALVEAPIYPHTGPLSSSGRRNLPDIVRRRRMDWSSRQEIFDSWSARPPFDTWRQDLLWLYIRWGTRFNRKGGVSLKCPPDVEAQIYENSRLLDIFERLSEVGCPTLYIRGARTDTVSAEMAEAIVTRLPKGQLATLPSVGHLAPMENPELVVETIERFFDQV